MSYKYRKCVMGCPAGEHRLHSFPKDAARYADWVRILGVKPSTKSPFICCRHFAQENMLGNRLSRYAIPKISVDAEVNKCSNPSLEYVPSSNESNMNLISSSIELQENYNLGDATGSQISEVNLDHQEKTVLATEAFENSDINNSCNATDNQIVEINLEDQEKELPEAGFENSEDINESCSQISALKRALDHCCKQLSEEKKHKIKLREENARLSQKLKKYKDLVANLGSESSDLNKHILSEVLQFITDQEKDVEKKFIYMIKNSGRYCDVNLINM